MITQATIRGDGITVQFKITTSYHCDVFLNVPDLSAYSLLTFVWRHTGWWAEQA